MKWLILELIILFFCVYQLINFEQETNIVIMKVVDKYETFGNKNIWEDDFYLVGEYKKRRYYLKVSSLCFYSNIKYLKFIVKSYSFNYYIMVFVTYFILIDIFIKFLSKLS